MHFAGSMKKQEGILTLTQCIIGYESQSSLNQFKLWSPFYNGRYQGAENGNGVD